MIGVGALLLGASGCVAFESPWEEANTSDATVEGWMYTAIDHPQPGAGWFRTGETEAADFSQASVKSVRGAKDDIVVLQIGSVSSEGPSILEIDVALGAWSAGAIPVDGMSSVGELRDADGTRRLVVDGVIEVDQAGVSAGQVVELSFVDLVLTEAL
ncbi:MAG: hypothetical protein KTR31_36240 [Myxococcales bacterium]|nr:hypothetical protein [Myxococcales bacterium]